MYYYPYDYMHFKETLILCAHSVWECIAHHDSAHNILKQLTSHDSNFEPNLASSFDLVCWYKTDQKFTLFIFVCAV